MVSKVKAEQIPAGRFQEPSEPSDVKPEDKPKQLVASEQEENPQVIAHKKGEQAVDRAQGHSECGGPSEHRAGEKPFANGRKAKL